MRLFSKDFWWQERTLATVVDDLAALLRRPRRMPAAVEKRLEKARSIQLSDGVTVLSLDVWSSGRKPCKECCWHLVESTPSHRSTARLSGKHYDYVCCQCTHGLCHTSIVDVPDKHPLRPVRRHWKIG